MKKTRNESMPFYRKTMNRKGISTNLFIIGFVSTSFQLLLMREILNISGGYELITGIYFGSWLMASAAGSAVAGRSGMNDIRKINFAFSASQLITILLLILLSRLFLEPGETPGFTAGMTIIFLILLPFCFLSGFAFIKLIALAGTLHDYDPGRSFSIETTGGIIAGILLTVLTSGLLNTGKILLLIVLLSFAYTLLNFFVSGKNESFILKTAISAAATLIIISEPDVFLRQMLMPGIKVTETSDTPYGNLTTGEYGGERSIYYNQRLHTWHNDAAEREENIHYAMLQTDNPRKVILISGSLVSCLSELKKYNLKEVIYVERDPGLTGDISKEDITAPFPVKIQTEDAYHYIKSHGEIADAVILLLPPPSTLALNRYYTTEFFRTIKDRLTPGGVFMLSPGPADFYLNSESVRLYSSVYNSMAFVFRNVKPVAGNKLYFIASDSTVTVNFCKTAEAKEINNIYVNCDFLADDLIGKKSDEVLSVIDRSIKQNTTSHPIASFYFQSYKLSGNQRAKDIAVLILIMVFAVTFPAVRRQNTMMYFAASSLAGFEIIMLLILQITIGNMYQLSGIVVAALMTGLAAGSGTGMKTARDIPVKIIAGILFLFFIIVALLLDPILSVSGVFPATVLILTAVLIPSFFTGYLFRKLTIADVNGVLSSAVYSADLAGSALGFILISAVMIPVFGLRLSIFLLSGLIFAGIVFGTDRNKY